MTSAGSRIAAVSRAAPCGLAVLLAAAAARADPPPALRTVTVGNRPLVQLRELASLNAMRLTLPAADRVVLGNGTHTLRFTANSREMVFNGTTVWLNSPVVAARGHWAVERPDAAVLLDPLLRPPLYLRPYHAAVVLIDPGHGGKDVGALGADLVEKNLTLDLARRVRVALANAGYRVHLTRDNDRFVELPDRPAMIARVKADLFVSLHFNAAGSGARGVETYLLPAAGYRSVHEGGGRGDRSTASNGQRHAAANAVLAHSIQRNLRQQSGLPDRGVRTAHYAVLKNATCPAALVECGFLSDASDRAFLRVAANRDRIALGIALGIGEYARAGATAPPRAAAPTPAAPRPAPAPARRPPPAAAENLPSADPAPAPEPAPEPAPKPEPLPLLPPLGILPLPG